MDDAIKYNNSFFYAHFKEVLGKKDGNANVNRVSKYSKFGLKNIVKLMCFLLVLVIVSGVGGKDVSAVYDSNYWTYICGGSEHSCYTYKYMDGVYWYFYGSGSSDYMYIIYIKKSNLNDDNLSYAELDGYTYTHRYDYFAGYGAPQEFTDTVTDGEYSTFCFLRTNKSRPVSYWSYCKVYNWSDEEIYIYNLPSKHGDNPSVTNYSVSYSPNTSTSGSVTVTATITLSNAYTSTATATKTVSSNGSGYISVGYKDSSNSVSFTYDVPYNVTWIQEPPKTSGTIWKNSGNTAFKLTATDDGGLSSIAYTSGTTIKSISGTSVTTNFVVDSTLSSFRIYDNSGLYTTVSSFSTDSTAPSNISTTRSGSTLTVTATDTESGLWKIEQLNTSNTVLNTAYFSPAYTTSSNATKAITMNNSTVKIRVYDGVNNYTEVIVDSPPSVVGTVWCNSDKNAFKLTTTDNSALANIAYTNASSIQALEGTSATTNFVVDSTLTEFRIYDDAGLYTTVSSFETDSTQPTASITRANNICTITATDMQSGLWKIEQLNSSDAVLATTNFDTLYTTESNVTKDITLDNNTVKVKVYDAVNNGIILQIPPLTISDDTLTISATELNGLQITEDCTLTFSGSSKIQIGDTTKDNAGITLGENVTLTIVNDNSNLDGVSIYGGSGTDTYGSVVKYAGINVKAGTILNIDGSGTIKVYGYGLGNGTGAGIGGNGVTLASVSSQALANAGTVNILAGTVYAYGGYAQDAKSGTGAGIGGGGIYNDTQTTLTGGALTSATISGGTTYAYGGSSSGDYATYGTGAGIGGGGVWDSAVTEELIGGNAGTISISNNATVDAIGGFTGGNIICGSGAGIGGGGVYHENTSSTTTGGGITSGVGISSTGDIRGVGGYCDTSYNAYGTGAGIGGGGVYSTTGNNVAGGSVAQASFTGSGIVTVKSGFGSIESKATGAHIGGGGVYTENNATNVTAGQLSNLSVSDNASINTFNLPRLP